MRFSLIPGISIAMVILSGIVVAAVWRGPFNGAHAWVALILAIGLGAVLALVRVGFLGPP